MKNFDGADSSLTSSSSSSGSVVIVLESSDKGCPLHANSNDLYHPNGTLSTVSLLSSRPFSTPFKIS
jgi:hypothetical protein